MIKVGEHQHGGFGPAQGGAPPHWLGHVAVDDVDEAAGRAEAAGGTIVAPAMDIPEVGRMVVVADPQGAVLSLFTGVGRLDADRGRLRLGRADDHGRRGREALLRRGRGLGEPRHGHGQLRLHDLRVGRRRPGGLHARPEGAEGMPPAWLTYLGTDDVDATVEKAKSLGAAAVIMEPTDIPTVGRLAVIADATGAAVGIYRPSEG